MPESAAVVEAVVRHQGPLRAYVARLLGNADAASDIVQDAFVKLWQHEIAAGSVKTWLYTVCRHAAIDRIRKEKRMTALAPEMELAGREPSPLMVLELREEGDAVLKRLATLTALQQEAVRLKFQEQFSYREIAEVMCVSVSHVGVLLHEALKALRTNV